MMEKKNIQMSNVFVFAISMCAIGSFMSSVFEKNAIASACFTLSFAAIFIRYFYDVVSTSEMSLWVLSLCALSLIPTINGISAGLNRTIITVSIVFLFDLMLKEKISKKCRNLIIGCFVMMVLVLLYLFYFGGYDKTYFGTTSLIDLNTGNPNLAGLWVCTIFILVFSVAFTYEKWIIKIGLIVISGLLLPIIDATGSRNASMSCLLCVAIIILSKVLHIKKAPNWCISLIVWAPLIALLLYMYVFLPNSEWFEGLIKYIEGTGKGVASREHVWGEIIKNIKNWALIGLYEKHSDGNLHNSILTMAANYGIPYTVLLFHYFYKRLCEHQMKKGLLSTMAVCCALFLGCFEASIFVGAAGLYLMALIIPVVSSFDNKETLVNE